MRLLFEIDKKDYDINGVPFSRPSARAIIFKEGLLVVIYSRKRKYVKFPGGGIEPGEDNITAMIREVQEEVGLFVIPETVREYGYVHRIQKGEHEDIFIQDNFYYLCEAGNEMELPKYTESERKEGFVPMCLTLDRAIAINEAFKEENPDDSMVTRELGVLKLLRDELSGNAY